MSDYVVWCPELGHEGPDDGATVKGALDAEQAAVRWAEREDAHSNDYWIVGGGGTTVMVRDSYGVTRTVRVRGEPRPRYYASVESVTVTPNANLDLGEQVRSRDVTQWAELPVPPMGHGATNGFDWVRRYAARLMGQATGMSEREASDWAMAAASLKVSVSDLEDAPIDWSESPEDAADEWLVSWGPE